MSEMRWQSPPWFRTPRHIEAEKKVRDAIALISDARTVMTIWEFERFVRDNIAELGYHGFINSIGEAMVNAAVVENEATALPLPPLRDKAEQ